MGVRCKCFTSPALSRTTQVCDTCNLQPRCALGTLLDLCPLLASCPPLSHFPALPQMLPVPPCHPTLCLRVCSWEASLNTHCVPSLVFCPGITVFYKSHTCTHVHPQATKNVPSNNLDAGDAAENKTARAPALEKLTLL